MSENGMRKPSLVDRIFYAAARLRKKSQLSAVKNTHLGFDTKIEAGSQVVDTTLGRHTFCGYNCTILNADIGSFCSIAQDVCIGGAAHPTHFVSTSPVFLSHRDSVKTKFSRHEFVHLPQTLIGHDVWIGYGAKIKSGVTIGTGAVIGMGAVVTRDVPPYTIVAGNPAREIRKRFEPRLIEALLQSSWWEFDEDRLKSAAALFVDPEAFLRAEGLL
ncbi:MAG TPA: CatB-related O-acetyltransferase [Devosia sp.]|nr:CatB-related O-acetyltransferase [Devosia sp.]